jgi:DNA-binding SARP family transcriptional activator
LLALLWPDYPEESARHSLRTDQYYLKKAIPEVKAGEEGDQTPLLLSDNQTVQINPAAVYELDVANFTLQLAFSANHDHLELLTCAECEERLRKAVDLYRGDFLADFYLPDSAAFEVWVAALREAFRGQALGALETLAAVYDEQEAFEGAETMARRQLELDNLRESAHRQLMVILARSGRRRAALSQYESCRQLLQDELGVEPLPETTELYERIRAGQLRTGFTAPHERTVRGYVIREQLGQGNFGVVYHAFQLQVGRDVALKVILPQFANHPSFIRRFETEAQLVARLEHPYIVPLYDFWREPDGAYLVMRWLRAGSLATAIERGPWKIEAATLLIEQIAAALATAHRRGVVHRDVKPQNILLDQENNAYLSDFGIALELMRSDGLTDADAVIGSPAYLSPEHAKSEPATAQSDIYSLGVVMHELLVGEHPFVGATPADQIAMHLTESLPPLREQRPDLPEALEVVIQQATAKEPTNRYQDALEFAAAFRAAASYLAAKNAGSSLASAPVEMVNPYRGLRAFQEADADVFYGRDALIQQLASRLDPAQNGRANSRFLAVVGPSGSGKSSVVKAGLIPALGGGAVPGSENWFVAEMVPGTHPLEELELALWPIAVNPPPSLVEPMQLDVRGMLRTIRRILPGREDPQLLLVIDQFEELFTLVEDEDRRAFFIDSLLTALSARGSPLRVVITLRADFYDRPLQIQSLGQLLKQHTELILPLTAEELTRAVREPASRAGSHLEEGLTEVIVAEVVDQPGALPLMQYALTELFERRRDHVMTREAYEEIGGVPGALGRRADEIYDGLDPAGQEATRQLFLRLVSLGEGVEDTRRRVLRSELEAIQKPGFLEVLISSFGAARLLTLDRDPLTRESTVEVAHEALLREWPRLRGWLDQSRNDVRLQRMLAAAANEWQAAGRDDGFLLRGGRLDQFEGWAVETDLALTHDELDFLDASLAERRQREAD